MTYTCQFFLSWHEKIWLQNCPSELNLLSNKDTLIISSYFFPQNIISKNSRIIYIVNVKTSDSFLRQNENSISFFDITISRQKNKFTTPICRKLTLSGVYTKYGSFILKPYKYNLLFTLLNKEFKLCSNYELFHQEFDKPKTIFEYNGYLKSFC